ncbi:MAG: hypothetical protein NTY03_17010 [Candidatus Bathyarchaeota archaeon]|jgi:hypothetical protein|nr:hypothetical protein [Candidatus Bathyarchaeota archaeon]
MKPEDIPKVIDKFKKRNEAELENLFGHGLNTVFGPYHIGLETKGFTVLETDNPEELANYSSYYLPELPMKIYPINDSNQMVSSYIKYCSVE